MTGPTDPPRSTEFIGSRIRRLREERGWSMQRLANESGVALSTIASTEKSSKGLQPGSAERIADGLGVPVHYLYTGEWPGGETAQHLPSIRVFLRETTALNDRDAEYIERIVRDLEKEQAWRLSQGDPESG